MKNDFEKENGIMIDGKFHHIVIDNLGTCPNECSMKDICEREDMSVCAIWGDKGYHFEINKTE